MPVNGRRARNHGPLTAATTAARMAGMAATLVGMALAAQLPLVLPAAAQTASSVEASGDPLVQRGVPAEATAENAVVARERALASGQRIAYERLASAMDLPRGLSDSQIESLVQSLVIESERITSTRYIGQITVNFSAPRVASLSGRSGSAAQAQQGPAASGPTVATLEAVALYRSFSEWVELNRRLASSSSVARVEVVTVAPDMARLRLGLRSQPGAAASGLADGGVSLAPVPMAPPGEGWRVSLAGFR